eukprot:g24205.t1
MSKVETLIGYRKQGDGCVEIEVNTSENWVLLGKVDEGGKFVESGLVDKESYEAKAHALYEWPSAGQ